MRRQQLWSRLGLSRKSTDAGGTSAELSTSPWGTGLRRAAAALLQVFKCGLWGLNIGLENLTWGVSQTYPSPVMLDVVVGIWAVRKLSRSQRYLLISSPRQGDTRISSVAGDKRQNRRS